MLRLECSLVRVNLCRIVFSLFCIKSGVVLMQSHCPLCARLIGGSDYKLIYRHYATLYFVFCVDSSESELGILDLIQVRSLGNLRISITMFGKVLSMFIDLSLCNNQWQFCFMHLIPLIFRYSWKRWTNALRMSVSLT